MLTILIMTRRTLFMPSTPFLFPVSLVREFLRVINLAQCLEDGLRTHRDRAHLRVGEREVQHERLDVAVENNADKFRVAVDHRAAGIAADDVRRADEIEGGAQIQAALALEPLWRD